ncbi:MAG: fibronectin type III domain-containing protein, partial [Nostocaceae cyanobacterium CSU_2_110]|nr:fibronectin type III domain-containing protein [Nostocaceae cyanobacterium CSU_2_110]
MFFASYNAQNIVIGAGAVTPTAGAVGSNPVDGYYNTFRYQTVYTATELTTAGLTPGDILNAIGFSVSEDYGGGALLGYSIRLAHTNATNAATHNTATLTTVKNAFDYNPTVVAAGEFDMLSFDSNFVWNGTDNILVDVCSAGSNPFTAPYGQVRNDDLTNGSRRIRTDSSPSQCGENTASTNNNRPQVRFNYTDGMPPSCVAPNLLTASVTSSTEATLSWNANGETNAEVVIQATGAGVPALPNNTGVNVSGSSYNATGLTAATAYEYYVRNECTLNTDFSTWSGPFAFNTTQLPVAPTLNTPVNNFVATVNQPFSLSWTPGVGGDPANSYDLFTGTTAGAVTNLVGNYTTTSANNLFITNYNSTVYWKVVAK